MTATIRPCLCPPGFVRVPGMHLVGCPHAPGDTVAPARNVLERPPPVDPSAGDPTDVGTREQHLAELDQAHAGRELLEQATGVDDTAAALEHYLADAWRQIYEHAHLEAETRTVAPRAFAERLCRALDVPLPAVAPELCTPAELDDYRARVDAGRRTARGRLLRGRRWLEQLVRR